MDINEKAQSVSRVRWSRTAPPTPSGLLGSGHVFLHIMHMRLVPNKQPLFVNLPREMRDIIRAYLTKEDQLALCAASKQMNTEYWPTVLTINAPLHGVLNVMTKLVNCVEVNIRQLLKHGDRSAASQSCEIWKFITTEGLYEKWRKQIADMTVSCLPKLRRLVFWSDASFYPLEGKARSISKKIQEDGSDAKTLSPSNVIFGELLHRVASQLTDLQCSTRFLPHLTASVCPHLLNLKIHVTGGFDDLSLVCGGVFPKLESLTTWTSKVPRKPYWCPRQPKLPAAGPQLETLTGLTEFDVSLMSAPTMRQYYDADLVLMELILRVLRNYPRIKALHMGLMLDIMAAISDKHLNFLLDDVSEANTRVREILLSATCEVYRWKEDKSPFVVQINAAAFAAAVEMHDHPEHRYLRLASLPGFDPEVLVTGPCSALELAAGRFNPATTLQWLNLTYPLLTQRTEQFVRVMNAFLRGRHRPVLLRKMAMLGGPPSSIPSQSRIAWLLYIVEDDRLATDDQLEFIDIATSSWHPTVADTAALHLELCSPLCGPVASVLFKRYPIPDNQHDVHIYLYTIVDKLQCIEEQQEEEVNSRLNWLIDIVGPIDWNAPHKDTGMTPLMHACACEQPSPALIAKLVGIPSVDAQREDNAGNTALHHFAKSARNVIHTEPILVLLKNGVSLTKRNHAGKSCLELLMDKDGTFGLFSSFLKEIAAYPAHEANEELLCHLEEAVSVLLVLESKIPRAACQGWELRLSSIRDIIESFESTDVVLRYVKSVRTWMGCVDIPAETIRRHLDALQQCGFSVVDSSETLSAVLALRQCDASFEMLRVLVKEMSLNLSEAKIKKKSIGKGYWDVIVSLRHGDSSCSSK